MHLLELTLPSAAENLALDEALLEEAEEAGRPCETLRIWEPTRPAVIVGRSSRLEAEVRTSACRRCGIPILRRTSGGAAVVTGPGCLMYALVLSYQRRPAIRPVSGAHQFVLETLGAALRSLGLEASCQGTSDLAIGGRKFSGNSMRCGREHMLYHGTLLYDFPLALVEQCLAMPPREPDYRRRRPHGTFVTNLPLSGPALRQAVLDAWAAREARPTWPRERTVRLVAEKYDRSEWNASR